MTSNSTKQIKMKKIDARGYFLTYLLLPPFLPSHGDVLVTPPLLSTLFLPLSTKYNTI
jgi:hypothetical protein